MHGHGRRGRSGYADRSPSSLPQAKPEVFTASDRVAVQPAYSGTPGMFWARGADPLRSGLPAVAEAETRGHWLAAEIMRAWIRRGQHPAAT
jgi:hypothetical protein